MADDSLRRATSDSEVSGQRVRFGDTGAAGRMLDNFARRERERRASFSEIQSWEGLQVIRTPAPPLLDDKYYLSSLFKISK